ncbi:MAG: hypothetical protein J5803_05980 [Desulfovibrio sp.]|nr:hypothetical protein [Desulfovibrio sp.]
MLLHDELSIHFQEPFDKNALFSDISAYASQRLHDCIKNCKPSIPKEVEKLTHICTHQRPHLDEYMAILLFVSCLPESIRRLPLEETVMTHATEDSAVREKWSTAAVFGLGGVQTGGAKPLLIFDEHVQNGQKNTASSAVSLVARSLFGRSLLPKPLFQILREIDIIDAFGGAHPKHLSNYILRMHDYAESGQFSLGVNEKKAVIDAALLALLEASKKAIPFWQESIWKERAISSFKDHCCASALRQQAGFEQAQTHLLQNLLAFRQPLFPPLSSEQCSLTFATGSYRLRQTILIPYLAALLPLVWGETCGTMIMDILWDARLLTQMHYASVLRALEAHFNAETDNEDIATEIGNIAFRKVPVSSGNAGMLSWVIEITPKKGISNARQALISFARKHNNDRAVTLLRNTETKSLVISRGHGIPKEQWDALIDWLVDWEGSSDTEGNPGCWHVVTNASGERADFILNGNAAHRYVPESRVTIDHIADWIQRHF